MTKLLTQSEAADFLGLTPRQVLRLAGRGELPRVVFPNREVRFLERDLADFIDQQRVPVVHGRKEAAR